MDDHPKPRLRRERGQTTAEFVLVLPALLLFFFLMVDFGWMLKNWIVVTNTAREVARCAVVDNCSLNGTAVNPKQLALGNGGNAGRLQAGITSNLTGAAVQLRYIEQTGNGTAGPGDSLLVCVSGNNQYISPVIPFLSMVTGNSSALPNPLPIRAREEMLLERTPTFALDGQGQCVW
jgi:Flp pilus assembly protein TadG